MWKNVQKNHTWTNLDCVFEKKPPFATILDCKKATELNWSSDQTWQNADGLEYSDEEDQGKNLDEIKDEIARKGKKELAKVDHAKQQYEPFQKSFYIEVPEIANMTSLEVEELRKELEGIQVRGKGNVPKPIKKWSQCGVSHRILETMKKLNYEKPTPIQVWSLTQSQISFFAVNNC